LFLGGGRGGGKTFGVILLILEHCERYGVHARVLVTRKRQKSLVQFVETLRPFVTGSYNGADGTFRLGNGATITCTHCENQAAVADIAQGMSFTLIFCDEAGDAPEPAVVDSLMLSLRSTHVERCRMVIAANPGGVHHAALYERFVQGRSPFDSFVIGAERWLYLPSDVSMNPHLPQTYRDRFEALRISDPARYEALRYGNWGAIVGAFFQGVWRPEQMVLPDGLLTPRHFHSLKLGADWGTASPAPFLLGGRLAYDIRLPDDRVLPEGAIVLLDEHVEVDPTNIRRGTGRSPSEIAPWLWAMCRRNGTTPSGWIDSAADARTIGASQWTVTSLFHRSSVRLQRCRKLGTRADRAALLRQYMANDQFYVSERCRYWLQTVPSLARDENDAEVPAKGSTDHAYDATTYLVVHLDRPAASSGNWHDGPAFCKRSFVEPPTITEIPTPENRLELATDKP
jgi:hypothetical protein